MKFVRDESNLHLADTKVLILSLLCYPILIVCFALAITPSLRLIALSAGVVVLAFGLWLDKHYDYKRNVVYKFDNKTCVLTYSLHDAFVPSSSKVVKYTVKSITKLVVKKDNAVVYGEITVKKPLRNVEPVKKAVLPLNFGADRDAIITEFNKMIIKEK